MDAAVFISGFGALVVIAALIFALTGPTNTHDRVASRDRDSD